MTKADELWEKYADLQQDQGAGPCTWSMRYDQFLAALAEYGEAVRAEAVKEKPIDPNKSGIISAITSYINGSFK